MPSMCQRIKRETHGQAAVETVLMLPFLLGLVFNAVNFAYFFIVAINVAAAPRSGVEYSILGGATPGNLKLPVAGATTDVTSVSYLTLHDMTGGISAGGSAKVQVCSPSIIVSGSGTNGSGTSQKANCDQYNSSPVYTVASDPEAPNFVLSRVDVNYTFKPLLDGRLFNLVLLASPICTGSGSGVTCTFHRQVSMRSMN